MADHPSFPPSNNTERPLSLEEAMQRIKAVQEQINVISSELESASSGGLRLSRPSDSDSAGSDQIPTKKDLKQMEDSILDSVADSRYRLVSEMEDQTLAMGFMIGIFVVSALMVFYYAIENIIRYKQCAPRLDGWDAVVKAAEFSLRVEQQQLAAAAAAPAAAPVAAV